MFKFVLSLGFLSSFISSFAVADPGLGSYARYLYVSQDKTGAMVTGTQTDSVVAVSAQNRNYQLQTEIVVSGQVNQSSLWSVSGNYFNDTLYFIQHCQESGGNFSDISVPAGKYHTCHMIFKAPDRETLSQEIWLSPDVPLFTVKQIRKSSDAAQTQVTIQLEKFESKTLVP